MSTNAGVLVLGLLMVSSWAHAFDLFSRQVKEVNEGNGLYEGQHFDQALEQYEQAEQMLSQEPRIHFNRGNALFKLGHTKEAREAFLRASGTEDPELKRKIYYNIGNTYLSEGGFREAMSYFRRSLEIDPKFDDARYNLELALQVIKQQQQKKDQSGKQDDSEEGDKNQENQKSDEQNGDQDKKDNQNKEQQKDDSQEDQKSKKEEKQSGEQKPDQEQKEPSDQGQQHGEQEKKANPQEQSNQPDTKNQQTGSEQQIPLKAGEMTQEQFRDMLKAMRENEKAFQMYLFQLPQFNEGKPVDKDW